MLEAASGSAHCRRTLTAYNLEHLQVVGRQRFISIVGTWCIQHRMNAIGSGGGDVRTAELTDSAHYDVPGFILKVVLVSH